MNFTYYSFKQEFVSFSTSHHKLPIRKFNPCRNLSHPPIYTSYLCYSGINDLFEYSWAYSASLQIDDLQAIAFGTHFNVVQRYFVLRKVGRRGSGSAAILVSQESVAHRFSLVLILAKVCVFILYSSTIHPSTFRC